MSEINFDKFQLNDEFINLNQIDKDELKEKIVELELKRCNLDQIRNTILEFYLSKKGE